MDALDFGLLLDRRPLYPGLGPFCGGGDGGAMDTVTEHTNPFSFGLDLACLSPHGFGPFSGGDTVQTQQMDAFSLDFLDHPPTTGFGPFPGAGAVQTERTNPFSFGLDLACPPPAGFNPFSAGDSEQTDSSFTSEILGPFPGGGAVDAPSHTNPFTFGLDLAPRPQLIGFGPSADDGAALAVEIPAACDPQHVGNGQTAAPAYDGANAKNTHTRPAEHYDDGIDATLREMEQHADERPSPDYLETTQRGRISPETRAALVLWMGEFTERYGLAPGTLHRAVSYADRFLSARRLTDDDDAAVAGGGHRQLRLLGAAAVYAAAKYEDRGTTDKLNAAEIAAGLDGGASRQEVLDVERALLAALDYRLGGPTAHTFVDHFTRHYYGRRRGEEGTEVQRAAHRLADMSLLDYGCLKLRPSAVAAAAIFVAKAARLSSSLKPSYRQVKRWNRELKKLTGYKPKDLEYGVEAMRSLMRERESGRFDDDDTFPVFYADPC